MTNTSTSRTDNTATVKVIGPIRCHKCQLMCLDAAHYLLHLKHKCESKFYPDVLAFPSLVSAAGRR